MAAGCSSVLRAPQRRGSVSRIRQMQPRFGARPAGATTQAGSRVPNAPKRIRVDSRLTRKISGGPAGQPRPAGAVHRRRRCAGLSKAAPDQTRFEKKGVEIKRTPVACKTTPSLA